MLIALWSAHRTMQGISAAERVVASRHTQTAYGYGKRRINEKPKNSAKFNDGMLGA